MPNWFLILFVSLVIIAILILIFFAAEKIGKYFFGSRPTPFWEDASNQPFKWRQLAEKDEANEDEEDTLNEVTFTAFYCLRHLGLHLKANPRFELEA